MMVRAIDSVALNLTERKTLSQRGNESSFFWILLENRESF